MELVLYQPCPEIKFLKLPLSSSRINRLYRPTNSTRGFGRDLKARKVRFVGLPEPISWD